MGKYFLKLPKMGESIAEATLVKWLKEEGDQIEIDESIVEIATDKVDSDIPSEVKGVLKEKKFSENDIIKVGEIIGVIETENNDIIEVEEEIVDISKNKIKEEELIADIPFLKSELDLKTPIEENKTDQFKNNADKKFLSPLVKNIIKKENINLEELQDKIKEADDLDQIKDVLSITIGHLNSEDVGVLDKLQDISRNIKKFRI